MVQFRLKALALNTELSTLAGEIHGPLVPSATFHGQIGNSEEGADVKEPLLIYVMNRIKGISHLDFILAHNLSVDSVEYCKWRENLIADIAGYTKYPHLYYLR